MGSSEVVVMLGLKRRVFALTEVIGRSVSARCSRVVCHINHHVSKCTASISGCAIQSPVMARGSFALALVLSLVGFERPVAAVEASHRLGNPYAYLSGPTNPYYVGRSFPRLSTPQWTGNPKTKAVVVLAIDDMRDASRYERFLRPILDRLKEVEQGRAPLSIMTNSIDVNEPQLQTWLREGLSIDVHTIDHPCPLLHDGDWAKAKSTYDRCVDLLTSIPNQRPVAYRMPCCDSMNSPSPRFYETIFNATTEAGNFLTIDSSVFVVTRPDDARLPESLNQKIAKDRHGDDRFGKYLPFPAFVNTIDDYPFPYVIGNLCWEFPCIVPSDWEAQNVLQPNNPRLVDDLIVALDVVVEKQGTLNLVFHPHGWMRNDQVVQLIDYAQRTYGDAVRFMSFRDAQESLDRHLLAGQPLRAEDGGDNLVRLLDVNRDGTIDTVRLTRDVLVTRRWVESQHDWSTTTLSLPVGDRGFQAIQFGVLDRNGEAILVARTKDHQWNMFRFERDMWRRLETNDLFAEIPSDLESSQRGPIMFRLEDVDGDGGCELLVGPRETHVYRWQEDRWVAAECTLPPGIPLTSDNGGDAGLRWIDLDRNGVFELVFSDAERCAAFRFEGWTAGWKSIFDQRRATTTRPLVPPFVLADGTSNGVWAHGDHLWWQNEQTDRLPDKVDRLPFSTLVAGAQQGHDPSGAGEADEIEPAAGVDISDFSTPLEPDDAVKSLRSAAPLHFQLVANEPQVMDPVAFDWGWDGTVWVVEMRDYPFATEGGPSGAIKHLFDDDGDGRFERAETFLDGLESPTGIKAWRDGVLICAPPRVLFARDLDGDGRADDTQVLFEGFAEGNQQHRANGFTWSLDGWLHMANGDSGGQIKVARTGKQISISGRDLRIRPDGSDVETVSGHTQFGRTRDDFGRWFGGNNSNPLYHYPLAARYVRRNTGYAPSGLTRTVPQFAGPAPVFPESKTLPRFNDYDRADRITSACGHFVVNYPRETFGPQGAIDSFVCEPVHNLVHRERLEPVGASFTSERVASEQQSEFLASTDNWFRPVMIKEAPDGSLWVADMYRLVIEHPEWIPQVWQEALDVRSGNDRGRLYRLAMSARPATPLPNFMTMNWDELLEQVESTNRWRRETAQQLILWRASQHEPSQEQREALTAKLRNTSHPVAQVHLLYLLDALSYLEPTTLAHWIRESEPLVAIHALRIAESKLVSTQEEEANRYHRAMIQRLGTTSTPLQQQLVCSLGFVDDVRAAQALVTLVANANDPLVTTSALTSLNDKNMSLVLAAVASSDHSVPRDFIGEVVKQAVRNGEPELQATAIGIVADLASREPFDLWAATTLAELLDRLRARQRHPSDLPPAVLANVYAAATFAEQTLRTEASELDARVAALELIRKDLRGKNGATEQTQRETELLLELLSPRQPSELQVAAGVKLVQLEGKQSIEHLLPRWRQFTPAMRSELQEELLGRHDLAHSLLSKAVAMDIDLQLDARRRQQLLDSEHESIRAIANRMFSNVGVRDEVISAYSDLVSEEGVDLVKGKVVFKRVCATCHQMSGEGAAVGPDLAALGNKSREFLLTAILDPNRAVESNYIDYRVETTDGKQFSGILTEETAVSISLLMPDGKRQPILREQIEELVSTGRSLMPEGLEKDVPPDQMRDLLGFLRSHRPPRNRFAGNRPQVAPMRDDGSIRLLAMHAEIYGPSLTFEQKYRNLGLWYSDADFAVWTVEVPEAGRYKVVLQYACHNNSAGNRWTLTCRDQSLSERVDGTGTWDNYRGHGVGTFDLPAGRSEIVMSAAEKPRSALIDVQQILLYPIDD